MLINLAKNDPEPRGKNRVAFLIFVETIDKKQI